MEGGKLVHSHSQPGGMDRTPPGTPKKGGKMLAVRVQMLDDSITMFQVQAKALGRVLFDQVCKQLHLLESDYFGLEYQEIGGTKYWLDLEKPLSRQIGLSLVDTLVRFCVKFYTPDPSQLEEEFTRYLFCLQIKRDLAQGLLQCNDNTAALMASYIVQAECGDYVVEDYPDHRYLSTFKFVPNQDQELERRIMENHKKHIGQSPAEADLNLLETARRCELYGIKMHPAKDHEGVPLNLAVAHMGIVVFQNYTKINTFSWAKIRKISFKRKRFLVKLHPEGYGCYKDIVEFFFEGRNECKNFWKKCVENHGFFRCSMVKRVPRQKTRVLSRGSSFRYSGRTQKQVVEFVRENYVKRQTFQRSQSFRHSSSAHSSVANVGTSISAHPLLPLGDNAVAGTPASLSCGSMTLTSSPLHAADPHAGGSPSPPLTTSVSPGTSVTSSPQHFYPQETPYRRAGHPHSRLNLPQEHSHHTTSPLQSPTNVATTAAINSSASHSNSNINNNNNGNLILDNDLKSSRVSLKNQDLMYFNDVYSNLYSSLRNLGYSNENIDRENDTKTEISRHLSNANSKSNESVKSPPKRSKRVSNKKQQNEDEHTWLRSSSCKNLYQQKNSVYMTESNNQKNLTKTADTAFGYGEETPFKIGFDSPITRYDDSRRGCYSAAASKTPSIDRTGDVITDTRIYSSSYPGTTSSLSTESVEGEAIEMFDVNDSQDEIVLSHDDVSHDSYELLEKEFDDFDVVEDSARSKKTRKYFSENERARSCSWGSEKGEGQPPLDSRSSEKIYCQDHKRSRENGFRSLERSRSPKHKSEMDFRSLDRKSPKNGRIRIDGARTGERKYVTDYRKKTREYYNNGMDMRRRSSKEFDDAQKMAERISPMSGRPFIVEEMDFHRNYDDDVYHRGQDAKMQKKYQERARSQDESEIFRMDSEEEFLKDMDEKKRLERKREKREKEDRFHEGIREKEQKDLERRMLERKKLAEESEWRRMGKKLDKDEEAREMDGKLERVFSNQFGKYPEFLCYNPDYELMKQERKVSENYEKVCQVGKIAKELERSEKALSERLQTAPGVKTYKVEAEAPKTQMEVLTAEKESMKKPFRVSQFNEYNAKTRGGTVIGFVSSPKTSPKGKVPVERTKSDPYEATQNSKRNVLTHQKSIDLTPQDSAEVTSDYDNDDLMKKTSRSEHDIPYILRKRHFMNGTAKEDDFSALRGSLKSSGIVKPAEQVSARGSTDSDEVVMPKGKAEPKRGVEIINLDAKEEKTIASVPQNKRVKPAIAKKPILSDEKRQPPKVPPKKAVDAVKTAKPIRKAEEAVVKKEEDKLSDSGLDLMDDLNEPIYAQVVKGRIVEENEEKEEEKAVETRKKVPPVPPKRTSSVLRAEETKKDAVQPKPPERTSSLVKPPVAKKTPPEPPKRTTSVQKKTPEKGPEAKAGAGGPVPAEKEAKAPEKKRSPPAEEGKSAAGGAKPKSDFPKSGIVAHKREELFARTRLGLSEGSAFISISRQGRVDSPSTQRRAKSLDAPVVSVHRLPPADAFSSKDDTVDENEGDMMKYPSVRSTDSQKDAKGKTSRAESLVDTTISTESEMDVFLPEDVDIDKNFKETVESQSKVEIPFPEEKVLDSVRSKRLLSKIDSMDSEGDLDSSRKAEPLPIPADRLVNLPESVRFPSVRQISGQTSEESADGWEQREVKVKRRTPRRSVGREDQDVGVKESVVWDSRDDEPPDDDVWDNNAVFTMKHNGQVKMEPGGSEYLKRGSCGQSIDDDNVSTPMKESSPEHWVSVDDLPEAIEREERFLREQEKILREKILNEKLKRELNLDTIEVDRRLLESYRQAVDNAGKDKFKGHSLDTYELTEKRLRERGTNKNSSLDEHILRQSPVRNYFSIVSDLDLSDKSSSYENVPKKTKRQTDYIKCKVVNNVNEIDQFGDNDEELEEFVVVLDEGLGDGKEGREVVWDDISFRRSLSKEESLISVPEEFKDVEEEVAPLEDDGDVKSAAPAVQQVEIRFDEEEGLSKGQELRRGERPPAADKGPSRERTSAEADDGRLSPHDDPKTCQEAKRPAASEDAGRLSPYRDVEEKRRLSASDDTGRLSPYDSSRRGSDDPRRGSASDDAGRLSPYDDSRRGSEDPRRLSTSEDSKHYSMSESVSEETRRRLSSTEETRRKRASLTKQCSVGVDSLSDDMIPGIQECSSSFEQDEKDVFESTNDPPPTEAAPVRSEAVKPDLVDHKPPPAEEDARGVRKLEIEVSEDTSDTKDSGIEDEKEEVKDTSNHLAPPTGERELSRETEDSMDYGEGDFRDIRETVKEKDISDGLICDNESAKSGLQREGTPSSFERSEASEGDELRYIDDKRGSTPEMIVGKSQEAAAISVVVVNEGISVLNRIVERDRKLNESAKARTLPKMVAGAGSTSTDSETTSEEQRHTLPKVGVKPKPLTPKPEYIHKKLTKAVPNIKVKSSAREKTIGTAFLVETSQESSQDSDVDRLTEVSLLAQIHSQIARRNLADAGKRLRREGLEDTARAHGASDATHQKVLSDDHAGKDEKGSEKKSPEQEKRDSGEDVSSSSSAPPHPKRELSSTWRPFLLESSGSSSLEEGWLPPDDNAHLADEEETSSNSNNQQDDSIHDDVIDYPTGIGYPVLNLSSAEMMVGGYSSVFALSRTLSRISERSTSEQERSDAEDDVTKPSSHSVSIEEESIISSDHQPSLSSDSASPKAGASNIPELPDDRSPIPENFVLPEDKAQSGEPFSGVIPPPVTDEDWPSPPSSSSVFDTPVVSHVETFYMEIHPEEAYKVVVAEPQNEGNSSSDENQTLQEEGELLHLSSDNLSLSTTTPTQDGTVIIPFNPPNMRTNSVSEDTSILSTSDWSSSTTIRPRTNSNFGTTEDLSDWTRSSTVQEGKYHSKQIGSSEEISEWSTGARKQTASSYSKSDEMSSDNLGTRSETWQSPRSCDTSQFGTVSGWSNSSSSKFSPDEKSFPESPKNKLPKMRPPKLKSPPSKNMGFFETPISKVRSPTSQMKFFERSEKAHPSIRSPTSRSESASPKNHGRFFDAPPGIYHTLVTDHYDLQKARSPAASRRHVDTGPPDPERRNVCTPYYSNVADKAEKSYYGQYDTGSLERAKMQPSRKSISYHSVVRIRPSEEDGSGIDVQSPPPTSNTIPRAAKKSRRRHRVALDIQIRDGKIVAPPQTRSTVLDNSDSDRSSPSFSSRRRDPDT